MKEQKNEFILWVAICAIIGLFILFMPNIERLIFGRAKRDKTPVKEEVKKEEVIKSGRVTCGSSLSDNQTSEYLLFYSDNKLNKVIYTVNTIYPTKNEEFNKAKETCDNISLKYANQTGFKATCTNSDLSITNKQEFDLKTYKNFTITNDDGSTETITMDMKYGSNIESVVKSLKKDGATCK